MKARIYFSRFFCKINYQTNALHIQISGLSIPTGRVSLAEYQYTQGLLPQLFQDTQTQTSVPAASTSFVGTQMDGRLWSQMFRQGPSEVTLLVVVCPFLYSNPNFGIVKFINYGCLQTGFVKLKMESYVYLWYFQICVVLVPSAPTFAWDYR